MQKYFKVKNKGIEMEKKTDEDFSLDENINIKMVFPMSDSHYRGI